MSKRLPHDTFGRPTPSIAPSSLSWTTVTRPVTPPPPAAMVSSRWARLGGAIVDSLVVLLPVIVLFLFAPASWLPATDGWQASLNVSVYGLTALLVFAAYNVLLISRAGEHNGQTLGKQLTGTRVVDKQGGPITLRTAILREVAGRALLGLVAPLGLADALAIFLPIDRRTLHDTIGGTLVVSAGWFPRAPVAAVGDASRSPQPVG